MINLPQVLSRVEKIARDNSPAILTALGVSGTITTAYLAGKASYDAAPMIEDAENELEYPERLSNKEKVKLVWDLYIPAGISGAVTIGCIIVATRVGTRRTAAITAAYSLSEKALSEYKEKVVEKLGEKKEKSIRDEIAQAHVTNTPSKGVIVAGSNKVLCFELLTGRYFECDMESLRKAENDINAKLMREMYASLSDFYYLIGLDYTTYSSETGWESDRLLELDFSTVMSDDNRPCIAFGYNYTKHI